MPRCYMVKKALCNKYMSVARGFESWGRAGRDSSPSPTAMQLPVSPIEACTAPPVAQECPTSQLKDLRASGNSPVPEPSTAFSPGERPSCATSASRDRPPEYSSATSTGSTTCQTRPLSPARKQQNHQESSVSSPSPSPLSGSTTTTTTSRQVEVASGISGDTGGGAMFQPSATTTTTAATTTAPRPVRASCITPAIPTSAQVSVVTMHHQIPQTIQHATIHQSNGNLDNQSTTALPLFFADNTNEQNSGPVCPGLEVLVPVQTICHLPTCGIVQDIPLLRDRSAAETEAAHDLLELSRSLPPLPPPSIAVGPQNVIETPPTDNVQEISIYQPAEPPPIYQLNTIDINGGTATVYQQQHSGIIYDSVAPTSTTTIVQQTPAGVFIPLSPVQEILFTYSSAPSGMPSIITTAQPAPIEAPPLTPPASECSSDIENNNPNSQPPSQSDKEVQTVIEQTDVNKAATYTYDTLLVADGRSKNKKQASAVAGQNDSPETTESAEPPEAPKAGRYVCCECGKQYATSSNLSRHKQTHRSIDSQSAKKCIHCGKAYVSMPALAMHVLTHKLTHSCGVCGKMFSRPWLLQGHLRSHTGEKPYGCAHCGKAFADRSNLRAHMQTHGSDKNYVCPKCPKSFALKSYLNKHLESACQRENCDESSNDVDTPTTYEVVPSPNSEPTSFPRMMRGVGEENT